MTFNNIRSANASCAMNAGITYGSGLFGFGFAFGIVRTFAITPWLGREHAIWVELPFMFIAAWMLCRYLMVTWLIEPARIDRMLMSVSGFIVAMSLELALGLVLGTQSVNEVITFMLTPENRIGLLGQIAVFLFPLVQRSGKATPERNVKPKKSDRTVTVKPKLLLLIMAVAVTGCTTTRRTPLPPLGTLSADAPSAWSVAAPDGSNQATSLVAWWTRFDDPVLTALMQDAMAANISVLTAQSAVNQARALRDVTAASLGPSLTGNASALRNTQGVAANARSASNNFETGVNGAWVLDVYGGRASALSASDAAIWMQAANLGDMQVQVAAELGTNYIALRNAQARLEIARRNLASQSHTSQIASWRRQAGLASALETEQADAQVAQTRASLPAFQTSIETASHSLSVLTGRPPASLNTLLLVARPVPADAGVFIAEIPAETLRQRADVRAAEYGVLQAMGRLGQADAATRPSFSLGGSLSLSSRSLGTLVNGSSVLSSLFGSIDMPIFDGGASRAQVRAEESALDQSRLAYRGAVLRALSDVENALVALRDNRLRLIGLQAAAASASRAADLARVQYRGGLIDFQVVLETQRIELASQDALAGAKAAISADQITLYKALGGGWTDATGMLPSHLAGVSTP